MTTTETTPEIKYISRNSKYYHEKVKANEQKRNEEKERIRECLYTNYNQKSAIWHL
jgi:hypothetical protein